VAGIESADSPGGEGVCFLRIDVMAISDSLVELIAGYHIQVFNQTNFEGIALKIAFLCCLLSLLLRFFLKFLYSLLIQELCMCM